MISLWHVTILPIKGTRVEVKVIDRNVPTSFIALLDANTTLLRIHVITDAKLVLDFTPLKGNSSDQLAAKHDLLFEAHNATFTESPVSIKLLAFNFYCLDEGTMNLLFCQT